MKIHCVFIQRACHYPGQYAPELVAAIDEIGNDDNPDYILGELNRCQVMIMDPDCHEIVSAAHIVLAVPNGYDDVSKILNRDQDVLPATVDTNG